MAIKTYSFVVVGNVNDGQKGDQGYGVQKATPQYYLSSSSTALTNGTWTYTKPSIPSGKYLWTRIQTTIDNPGKTKIYSDAVYDASTTGLSQTVDQNTQKITSKVWQTDITSSINSYDGSTGKGIRDRVTKTETDIGGLKTTVSDQASKIATKADGTTVEALTNRVSKNEQDADSFKTTVSKTYETKTDSAGNLASSKSYADSKASSAQSGAQSYTDNKLKNYSTTSQMTSAIDQKANSITSEVKKVDQKIDDLQVGGRNLLKNSAGSFVMGYAIPNTTWNSSTMKSEISLPATRVDGRSEVLPQIAAFELAMALMIGSTYTQSIVIETDANIISNESNWSWFDKTKGHVVVAGRTRKIGENAYLFSSTYTIPETHSGVVRILDLINLYDCIDLTSGTYLRFYHPKIEIGNQPTDWSPAPEDLTSYTDSKIKQTSDSITTTVSKTYSTKDETSAVSSIANQTADKISWLIDSKATATSLVLTDSAINAVTDKMTITGSDGSTTIISGGSLHAGSITTNDLAANAIKSKNYVAPSRSTSPYSSAGSFFDLSNGNIQTPSFGVRTSYTSSDPLDDQGNAFINGRIVAQSGQIGRNSTNYWAIGNSVDYNANESASIVGHGTAYIQSGNWQISNNSINTQSYNSSNSIIYPHYNGHYYDYGMKVPDLDPSASGYNDASGVWLYVRRSASDKIPTVYSDWNYLFRVDKDGTIYENGVKLSDRYASIADVGSAYLSTKNGGTVNGNVTITGNLTATASNAKQVANALTVNGKTFNGSAAVNVGTIGVSYGGTGRTSWTSGALLYASGSTALSSLESGSNGSFLISHGNGAAPVWIDPSNLTVGNANHVYASGIRWGNQPIAGSVSPIDAAMFDGMASNVLSFANPSGITVEYSNNGGSTWTAYPTTDANKIALVTPGIPVTWLHLGNKTTAQSSNADQLRITFDARNMGVYCAAKFLMIYVSQGGSTGMSVKIETANSQSLTTFTTMGTYSLAGLAGWSGWNSIPWLLNVFGTNGYDNQPVIARMTFSFSGYVSGWESKTDCAISRILMFATNKWATPSNYATSGHLYQMDTSQNAYFPAQIKASAFNGNASTATKLATARTISLSGAITGSGTFDGSNNLAITTSVGNLSYLPLSGGTVTGNLTVNGTITGHLSGNASTATAWQTARTLTVGNTGKSVNGSSNVSWSKAEISGDATNTANGWMSAEDKKKLDSITVSQIGMVGANSIVGAGDVKVTITNGIATVEHANKSITAGTVSGGSGTLSNGGSFTIPKVTYDAYGHITGTGTTSVTLPMITSISGNAATATKLASARTISLSGAITGSGTFDGSNNLAITTSVGNLSYLPLSGGTVTGNLRVNGIITGNLSGNASTATKATQDGNGSVISSTYLKLAGGTMVSGAKINFVSNSSTVSDAINRGSSINVEGNGSAYSGWISGNTKLGRMAIATNPGNDENLYFAYNNSELAIYITTQDDVLTAHVYRGGSELSTDDVAKLGAIHWYASGGTEILATGATYKASGAVVNIEARLEA